MKNTWVIINQQCRNMKLILTRRGKKRATVYVGKLPSPIYILLAHISLLILIIFSNYCPVALHSPPLPRLFTYGFAVISSGHCGTTPNKSRFRTIVQYRVIFPPDYRSETRRSSGRSSVTPTISTPPFIYAVYALVGPSYFVRLLLCLFLPPRAQG